MDYVEIKVSKDEIKKELLKYFNPEKKNVSLILNIIITHLCTTDVGLEALYKALNGVEMFAKFKIDEEVLVKRASTHYWRMDDELCYQKGVMINDYVKATITGIDLTKSRCYSLRYIYYATGKPDEPITEEHSYAASDHDIRPLDVLPFEDLD
jgi:hypothetical protein